VVLTDGEIVLRPWRDEDAPAVTEACNDADSMRWLPGLPVPYGLADARAYIRGCLEAGDDRYAFAIADGATDELLGSIDISRHAWGTGHVGYWVAPWGRGRGVCTRALRLLSAWALGEAGFARVELMTDPENRASQRVAEKAGYTNEGRLRSVIGYRDGRRADAFMWSRLPGEPGEPQTAL
jgi:RimJ/RimL family protein N-acetyltransferase